jgi:hypothetical protein
LHCSTPTNSQVTKCQIQGLTIKHKLYCTLLANKFHEFTNLRIQYSNDAACVKLLQKTRLYEPYPCEDRSFLSVDIWQPGIEQKVGMVANVSL